MRSKNKKAKIALSFASPEKENYYFFIHDVITWEKGKKGAEQYYLPGGLLPKSLSRLPTCARIQPAALFRLAVEEVSGPPFYDERGQGRCLKTTSP